MKIARPSHWFRPRYFPTALLGSYPILVMCLMGAFYPSVRADNALPNSTLALSFSGQFIVTGSAQKSPLLSLPAVTTNSSFVSLQPALLSVSAERIKQSLYRQLGIPSVRSWQGKVYLNLRPALWTDENVTVVAQPIDRSWSYSVQLPSVVQSSRYLRGLTGVLLLEYANRRAVAADAHSAELPAWLIDGLARQMQHDELSDVVLSSTTRPMQDPVMERTSAHEENLDVLAEPRKVLRKHSVLTYDQLCWPSAAQLAANDAGVYNASAQLFVAELLQLNDGPARLRRMLEALPQGYNWQTAFQKAYHDLFPRPLDLEKWWALQTITFLSHDPGPAWNAAVSAGWLNEMLTVPVQYRASSNALPSHAEMTLQTVVRTFDAAHQTFVLQARLQELRTAQLRMAPQFIALTDAYCQILAAYLGERLENAPQSSSKKQRAVEPVRLRARDAIKRLDALDARRRTLEAAVQPNGMKPNLALTRPST